MTRLSVATYNLHSCRGFDGRADVARSAALLRALDADFIGLQEVASGHGRDAAQLDPLRRAVGYVAVPGSTLLRADRDSGIALLSRHPLQSIRTVDLSETGREPRGALSARLRLGALTVRVTVTHLGLCGWERRRQVDRLCGALDHDTDVDIDVVLGDFNEWRPGGGALRPLRQRYGRPPAPATFPSRLPVLALDRIWAGHAGQPLPIIPRTVASPAARAASDHLPLRADLGIAGA